MSGLGRSLEDRTALWGNPEWFNIGQILGLSPRTVDSYIENACAKLKNRTRIEAVAVAVRSGLIDREGVSS